MSSSRCASNRKIASKPVTLKLKLDYAVCERLCIPVEAKADLAIDGKDNANDAIVSAAEAAVPKAQAFRAAAPLAISNAVADPASKPARILIDVTAPKDTPVTLFAEGPTAGLGVAFARACGRRRQCATASALRSSLDGVPSGASTKGAILKITAVCRRPGD